MLTSIEDNERISRINGRYKVITAIIAGVLAIASAIISGAATYYFSTKDTIPVADYDDTKSQYEQILSENESLRSRVTNLESDAANLSTQLQSEYERGVADGTESLFAGGSTEELESEIASLIRENESLKEQIAGRADEPASLSTIAADPDKDGLVYLKDMDYFVNESIYVSNDPADESTKDNLGNQYKSSICPTARYNACYITYKISGKYSGFEGTYYQTYEERSSDREGTMTIYGDDLVLFTAKMTRGIDPIPFTVDLSGVQELRVEYASDSNYTAIGDPVLYS